MATDYYAILGVPPTADLEAIRQAYRRQALANHPDQGGSHEGMIRVNEAWNVLSNPVTRAEYDQFRDHGQSVEAYHTTAAEKARSEAADYPADWNEFDRWWNGLAADFHNTKFKRNKGGGWIGLVAVAETPSGLLFIVGGVLFVWLFIPDGTLWPLGMKAWIVLCLILTVGSWLGAFAHWVFRTLFLDAPAQAGAGASRSFSTATYRVHSAAGDTAPATTELPCPKCGQVLRVPKLPKAIRVTCKSCQHVFQKAPSTVPPPLPTK